MCMLKSFNPTILYTHETSDTERADTTETCHVPSKKIKAHTRHHASTQWVSVTEAQSAGFSTEISLSSQDGASVMQHRCAWRSEGQRSDHCPSQHRVAYQYVVRWAQHVIGSKRSLVSLVSLLKSQSPGSPSTPDLLNHNPNGYKTANTASPNGEPTNNSLTHKFT